MTDIFHGECVASVVTGDACATLRAHPPGIVHTCVTSPPYFGLRDYGHAGQIGLEATPEAYVARLVDVFREVRRVLRDDGTLWLNLGDSYSTHAAGRVANPMAKSTLAGVKTQEVANSSSRAQGKYRKCETLPEKNLIGIPWRVAFALQADGWYLRQDIIWAKPNPMPESVTDRCTKAHEYLFLLSKSPRYYFDHEAIKEPVAASTKQRLAQDVAAQAGSDRVPGKTNGPMKAVRSKANTFKRDDSKRAQAIPGQSAGTHRPDRTESDYDLDTRNRRSVWTIATRSYKGAHFATFPPQLIEPCILAGCPPGGLVLDPFSGSGTTAAVALKHGRNALGIELNAEYAALTQARIASIV